MPNNLHPEILNEAQPLFSSKLFRQQMCYFKNLDYSEEVFYLGDAAVSDETIRDFLTQIATSD